jgi:hypothetical protein
MQRLISQALEHIKNPKTGFSMEAYQEAVESFKENQVSIDKTKQAISSQIQLLKTSRLLRKTGRTSDGTFLMLGLAVENIDEEVEMKDPPKEESGEQKEEMTSDQAHKLVEEGIVDSVKEKFRSIKEKFSRGKSKRQSMFDHQNKGYSDARARFKKAGEKIGTADNDFKISADVFGSLLNKVVPASGKFTNSILSDTLKDYRELIDAIIDLNKKTELGAQDVSRMIAQVNFNSDSLFEKTFISKIGSFTKYLGGKDIDDGRQFMGGYTIAYDAKLKELSEKNGEALLTGLAKHSSWFVSIGKYRTEEANSGDVSKTEINKSELVSWCKAMMSQMDRLTDANLAMKNDKLSDELMELVQINYLIEAYSYIGDDSGDSSIFDKDTLKEIEQAMKRHNLKKENLKNGLSEYRSVASAAVGGIASTYMVRVHNPEEFMLSHAMHVGLVMSQMAARAADKV